MTTAADLTPHRWEADERHILRAFILTLAEGNHQRAQEHAASLPLPARRELLYALDVGHPMVRALVAEPVPCPRCGHADSAHYSHYGNRNACAQCPARLCSPVVLSKQTVAVAARAVLTDGEAEAS